MLELAIASLLQLLHPSQNSSLKKRARPADLEADLDLQPPAKDASKRMKTSGRKENLAVQAASSKARSSDQNASSALAVAAAADRKPLTKVKVSQGNQNMYIVEKLLDKRRDSPKKAGDALSVSNHAQAAHAERFLLAAGVVARLHTGRRDL